uniref:Uncharacterized protein n=2 Tax=Ditylum brightwellii TaxID=49249 RepID=A0A7S4T492_9STRA|mmetsp:Transcript_7979/g.10689  ORF Transcript_7979/g.10689 Transcript_7979/m.10689 type:complete len:268 (-) Transcript_7979:307-1110(-)
MLSPKCLIALLALTTVASAVDVEVNKIPVENVEQSEVEQSHRRVKGAKSGRFRHGRGRRHRPNYYYHPYKPTFEYREECVLTACIEFYYDLPDHPDHDDGHRELWPLTHSWKPSGSAGKVNLFYKKGHGYGTWNDDHTGHFGGSSDFSFDYDLHGLAPNSYGRMSIRTDNVCEAVDTSEKNHHFNNAVVRDPYKGLTYNANYAGYSYGWDNMNNGYRCQGNVGKTVYLSMPEEGIYGCGVLTLGKRNCKRSHKKHKKFYSHYNYYGH